MNCHAGQAWVGIRVQLGHEAGLQIPNRRSKNTPSRQRRRARRAAARAEQDQHAEEEVGQNGDIAEEALVTNQPIQKEAATMAGNRAVQVIPVTPVDEFCSNEEFHQNTLNDENSVTFRFIVQDPTLSNNEEAFKKQVNETSLASKRTF